VTSLEHEHRSPG